MQTIVWVMKPHREARCKLCGNAALLPMDKPARAGGYICRRCRLAVIFGRIMEVVTTIDGKSRTHMSATDGFVAEAQAGGKWAKVVITAGEPLSVYYDGKRIGGAGWVLFGLDPKPSCFEVFNDADGNLINLYRCIKYHCAELQRELEGLTASREMFFDYKNQLTGPGLTDIQRAARFYYLIRCSFGSSRRTFKTSQIVFSNRLSYLSEIQERLKRVTIENLDFAHLIRTYDRPDALFYLGPPYWGTERHYDAAFSMEDHRRLRDTLSGIKGKFVLSYGDCPEVRELYTGYKIEGVSRKDTLSTKGNNQSNFAEVIISNF